jgi:chromate transporter
MVLERRRWLSGAEFTELLSLCQFLPGGNIINLSVAIFIAIAVLNLPLVPTMLVAAPLSIFLMRAVRA